MHTNHRRPPPRSRRDWRRWRWYKQQWNRHARRYAKRCAEQEDEERTCRHTRRQKTRIIYW